MSTDTPLLPLELRLRTIEAQVLGVPPAISDQLAGPSDHRPITRRIREIHEALERVSSSSDALKRLINEYPQYLPLLTLNDTTIASGIKDGGEESISMQDLLPDSTKVTMLLEAQGDICAAERDLREIALLRDRGVEGSGNLEDLIPLKPQLIEGIRQSQKRSTDVEKVRSEIKDMLLRYNEYTNTVSELFLDLHQKLEMMEERVAREERRRKKEADSRY